MENQWAGHEEEGASCEGEEVSPAFSLASPYVLTNCCIHRYILWSMEQYRLGNEPSKFAYPPKPKKTIRGSVCSHILAGFIC